MPAEGLKPVTVDTRINMFGETRSKKAPEWFAARPKVAALPFEIPVKKTMSLDPRKWKKSDIEAGIYAVARYELQIFATALAKIEKDLAKALPKDRKKLAKKPKDESKEETAALDKAATEVTGLHKKYRKAIVDKVSIALDEVESDKGDNKKAIAAGKEALKKFESLRPEKMFEEHTVEVVATLDRLGDVLDRLDEDARRAAFKAARAELLDVQKSFVATGRETQNVIRYLFHKGAKMAKDKDADPALQKVGAQLSGNGPTKGALDRLSATIVSFGKGLDETIKIVTSAKATGAEIRKLSAGFRKEHGNKDRMVADAVKVMRLIGQRFKESMKAVKA